MTTEELVASVDVLRDDILLRKVVIKKEEALIMPLLEEP